MREILLPCGCHKIDENGGCWSTLKQESRKGVQGIKTIQTDGWHKISGTLTKKGYVQVVIHGRTIRLNRLLAQNFIPNPLCYPEAHHINDVKTDNRIVNLKWGNQKHNAEDRERNGKSVHGERSPHARLTDDAVREIRESRKTRSLSLNRLANKFNVSKKLILLVEQRKIWTHI